MSHKVAVNKVHLSFEGSAVWKYVLHCGSVGVLVLQEDGPFKLKECTHPELVDDILRAWLHPLPLADNDTLSGASFSELEPSTVVKAVQFSAVAPVPDFYDKTVRRYGEAVEHSNALSIANHWDVSFKCELGSGQLYVGDCIENEFLSKSRVFEILSKGVARFQDASSFKVEETYSDECTDEMLSLDKYFHRLMEEREERGPWACWTWLYIPHLDEIRYEDYRTSRSKEVVVRTEVVLNASRFQELAVQAGLTPIAWDALGSTSVYAQVVDFEMLAAMHAAGVPMADALSRIHRYTYFLTT